MGIGFSEFCLLMVVFLLVFGAKRLPELAKALGRASYEFRKAKREILEEDEKDVTIDINKNEAE